MWVRAVLCLITSLPPGSALAGAWARGEGKTFLSFETTATTGRGSLFGDACRTDAETCADGVPLPGLGGVNASIFSSLFAEYGLGDRLTVGVDAGFDWDDDSWTTLAFLRRSFPTDGANVWAVEIAIGPNRAWDGSRGVTVRPGLHWGRGTDWGWFSAESYLVARTGIDGIATKLDVTTGWNRSEGASWMVQIQAADYPGSDPTVRLAPSYVRTLAEGRRIRLGVVADLIGREDVGLAAATWIEF